MIIVGIDPGFVRTGIGVIRIDGNKFTHLFSSIISTSAKECSSKRLFKIHDGITKVILDHAPDAMAVESVFMSKNASSALKLGQVRGVALLAAAEHGLSLHEYAPKEVKAGLTGYGMADKDQVAHMVKKMLGVREFKSNDQSDALALAIYHANRYGFSRRVVQEYK